MAAGRLLPGPSLAAVGGMPLATTIRRTAHAGLAAVEIRHGGQRLVAVHEVGPRIAWYGRDGGDNLLYWDERGEHARGAWSLRGGHRLWVTRPGADESEETYGSDDAPCTVTVRGAVVTLTAPPDRQRIERSLRITPAGGGFALEHRLRNAGDMLWSGGAWALTCTRPRAGTRYGVPLGAPDGWDVVHLVVPRRWGGGHSSMVADPQIAFHEHAIGLRPRGIETKRMLRCRPSMLGMSDPRAGVAFVKRSRFDGDGCYPLACNLAFYVGPRSFMVELETMSPQRVLAPGALLVHDERWTLGPLVDWRDPAAVAALVATDAGPVSRRLPASSSSWQGGRRSRPSR
jgi:hypothetical protein